MIMNKASFIKNILRGLTTRVVSLFRNPYREVNVSWLKLKFYKHLPSGKLRTHYLFGKPFFFSNPKELLHAFDEIFIEQVYKQQLQEQPYICDCGANIGLSVIYMKHLYPKAEIVAFEPDKENFDLLEKNMKSFGYNNITLRNEAVWNQNTTLRFSSDGSMSSKITTGNSPNTKEIKAIRLRDFLIRQIDFLKIDIEEAEFTVINDISDKLHFVKNMFVEYHGSFQNNKELVELLKIITDDGFNFYIKEANHIYITPFLRVENTVNPYDIQLNIFCFRA